MKRSAVIARLLPVEPDILQGHVSAVGKGNERVRVGRSIFAVGAGDQRPGGVAGTGGAIDVSVVLRSFCFSGSEGNGTVAVVDYRLRKTKVLQYLQLQSVHRGQVPVCIDEASALCGGEALLQRGVDGRETFERGLRLILPDLMSLHIEQLVICIRQLADDLLVGNHIAVLRIFGKLLISCGTALGGRFPLAEGELDRCRPGRCIFDLLELQLEDPVALCVEGVAAAAVSLGIRSLQQVIGAERQLAEINHALGERFVVLVLEGGSAVCGFGRGGIVFTVAAPEHELGITVLKGVGLTAAVQDRRVDRKGRTRQFAAGAVHLHKADLVVVADVFDAHIAAGKVGAQHRLAVGIQREDAVVLVRLRRMMLNQRRGIADIERAAVLPKVSVVVIGSQIRRADEHQIGRVVFLKAGGNVGLLHVIGADADRGELHHASGKKRALGVGIVLSVRGLRCRHSFGAIGVRIKREARAGDRDALVVLLHKGNNVHLIPVDVYGVCADLYTGQIFAVAAVGYGVGQGIAQFAQAFGRDCNTAGNLCKLFIGQSVGALLRPDPDDIARQLAEHIN